MSEVSAGRPEDTAETVAWEREKVSPDTPWLVLRRAAERLAELAGAAPGAPWTIVPTDPVWDITDEQRDEWRAGRLDIDLLTTPQRPSACYISTTGSEGKPGLDIGHSCGCCMEGEIGLESAAWITALSPAVAEPLVAWLRDAAVSFQCVSPAKRSFAWRHALEFAREVLGEQVETQNGPRAQP